MIEAVIADDEQATADMVRYFLETAGIPVSIVGVAENGEEALRLIQEKKPSLVFLDIQMPLMNGFEIMERIDTNVIVITAYDSFYNAQQALRLGAKDILLKPVDKDQLFLAISRALGRQFTGNSLADKALNYIHQYYMEKISLVSLAAELYVTGSHLSRTFKTHVGSSIGNYINLVRVGKAKELLAEGSLPIKEIAYRCGYESLNNFYKYFKMEAGLTPAAYRRLQGAGALKGEER